MVRLLKTFLVLVLVHSCKVADSTGCTETLVIDIIEPSVLVLNPTSTDATCNGVCDGTASVAPAGGTPVYTYVWTPNVSSGLGNGSLWRKLQCCCDRLKRMSGSTTFVIQVRKSMQRLLLLMWFVEVLVMEQFYLYHRGQIHHLLTVGHRTFPRIRQPLAYARPTYHYYDNTGCSIQEVVVINEPQPITLSW